MNTSKACASISSSESRRPEERLKKTKKKINLKSLRINFIIGVTEASGKTKELILGKLDCWSEVHLLEPVAHFVKADAAC